MREVRGNYVAVINPIYKGDSPVYMDEATKMKMMEEELHKLDRIKIYKVGPAVSDLNEGDEVYITSDRLTTSPRISLSGVNYVLVREHDIIFKY